MTSELEQEFSGLCVGWPWLGLLMCLRWGGDRRISPGWLCLMHCVCVTRARGLYWHVFLMVMAQPGHTGKLSIPLSSGHRAAEQWR